MIVIISSLQWTSGASSQLDGMRISDAIRERCMNLNLGNCDDKQANRKRP